MSKAANTSIFILLFLLAGTIVFSGMSIMEKQKVEVEKVRLEEQVLQAEEREKNKIEEIQRLKEQIAKFDEERDRLTKRIEKADEAIFGMKTKVSDAEVDRDRYKRTVDGFEDEKKRLRDQLADLEREKEELERKLTEAKRISETRVAEPVRSMPSEEDRERPAPTRTPITIETAAGNNEEYWAGILREKVELESQVKRLEDDLSSKELTILELRDQKENLELELDNMKFNLEEFAREIKYKENMVNNLSLQLAQEKNNKKFSADRVNQLANENKTLRQEITRLGSSKLNLEKSIVRVKQDKEKIEKQLLERENLIQGKIDEIWEIKESLDNTFRKTKLQHPAQEVELPPILVSSQAQAPAVKFDPGQAPTGFNGSVVSVNQENNFVVVNLGEKAGMNIGNELSVYRDDNYIARLRVIQLRQDISAADIIEQRQSIEVGDVVR